MSIKFPSQTTGGQPIELEHPSRVVVVGANGSGKTRFGIWLEENNQASMPVHRVGAQKALSLPDYATVKNLEQAEKDLYYGRSDQHASLNRKSQDRWGGNPATHMLSDYGQLLSLMFAMDAERDREHTRQTRELKEYVPVPESVIDQIGRLWQYLMPQRSIVFRDGKVTASSDSSAEYHAKEMSDGERVTLYLLGQCLTASENSLLVIDEPELHLHRSLMDKLWNKIEELCPNKSIVYITHDLDFAASRAGAKKYWIKSYESNEWNWSELPADATLPESLVLELVGNRKPVLFCEGERGGLDHSLYQICYPEHHVLPRGSADKVSESVKALNANADLHTVDAFGLVDRDVKSETEISALEAHDVFAIPFAEVENLLCNELLVRAIASELSLDPDEVVQSVTDFVAQALSEELELQIVLRAARRVRYHLSCYSPSSNDRGGLELGVDQLVGSLDLETLVTESESDFANAVDSGQLDKLLKLYNRKSLSNRISGCFGLAQGEYQKLAFRLLKGGRAEHFASLVKSYLPNK